MSQVTAVTLSDGTVVNTFPNSIDGELVSRAFTELFAQIQSQATDIAENDAIIDQLRADLAARATAEQPDVWISVDERLPEVKQNDTQEFIVACRRAFNGKTYVFSAEYANDFLLNGEEDQRTITGWFLAGEDNSGEYDTVYTSVCNPGDVVTHWQRLPVPPTDAAIESQRSGDGS